MLSGKGGVGRTVMAATIARFAAKLGRRVLLTEVAHGEGEQSALAPHFGRTTLRPEPIEVESGLHLCHLWARAGHEQFLSSVLPSRTLIRAALRSRAVEKFLVAAPSFHEMGVFYHLLTLLTAVDDTGKKRYDFVVIDMPATGHALALTGLPDILLRLMPGGPIATALKKGQSILNDPNKSEAWIVTLPEQLPVSESLELVAGLKETNISVGGILLNRMPPNPFTQSERDRLEKHIDPQTHFGVLSLDRLNAADEAQERLEVGTDIPVLSFPELSYESSEALSSRLAEHIKAKVSQKI